MVTTQFVSPWARLTAPDEPGSSGGKGWEEAAAEHFLWEAGLLEQSEIPVNHTTALTYSAVFACVRIISQTIASMPWHQFENQASGGKRKIGLEDNISWLLDMQASDEVNAFEWRQAMLKDALTWGNGVSEIERDGFGRVRNLYRIDPSRVSLVRTDGGSLLYVVDEDTDNETFLTPDRVFHLKGMSPDGLVGYSVIDLARRYIQLGLDIGKFGEAFFKRGPLPGGVLEMPGRVTKLERDDTRKSFEKVYGGSANAGRVIVLSGGAKFTAMTLPNTDAQFIESGTMSILDICRFYGVPPHKIAELSRSTNNNIEHQGIEFHQDCIFPWCRRLETEADIKLFGRINRGVRYTRINIDSLLRGDSKTQTETVTEKVNNGLLTVNEGRDYFGMNPIPGGDTPLVQGAMVPLERVLEEPEPAPPPGKPPAAEDEELDDEDEEDGDEEEDEVPEDVAATYTKLLSREYDKLLKAYRDKSKRDKLDFAEHRKHVQDLLLPIMTALALLPGRDISRAESAAELLMERYSEKVLEGTIKRTDLEPSDELKCAWRHIREKK